MDRQEKEIQRTEENNKRERERERERKKRDRKSVVLL